MTGTQSLSQTAIFYQSKADTLTEEGDESPGKGRPELYDEATLLAPRPSAK